MPEPANPADGLTVHQADALWDAVAIPGPHTPTFTEQHERVCRTVAGILAELPPPADGTVALTSVRPHTLASIACHLDARAVTILRPESQTYAEWQTVVAELRRLADEEPEYTESVLYEVVGNWGVDSADSAANARAAVAKWLKAYPTCGAHAQQRIYREWPDGSEWYGPWTDLPQDEDA